jgi:DNA repair protein RadC
MSAEDSLFQHYSHVADRDLLQKLIGTRESRRLYRGSLTPLFAINGTPSEKCLIARELVKRWLAEETKRESVLNSPGAVREYLQIHLAQQGNERFVAVFLDAQNRVIEVEELFRGTLTQTSVYPREVVKAALRHNAAAVIISHNHPSGVADPSIQDQSLTRTLIEALALVDVKLLDHFIVANARTVSFAERGLL